MVQCRDLTKTSQTNKQKTEQNVFEPIFFSTLILVCQKILETEKGRKKINSRFVSFNFYFQLN